MTFFMKHTSGDPYFNIADGTLDRTSSSLVLVGKNYPAYGEIFNQNMISLMENFAYNISPENPTQGQLWYDTNNQNIKLYRTTPTDSYWQSLACLVQAAAPPSLVNNGDMWWDSKNGQLNVFYNNKFITIGPQITNPGELRTDNADFTLQVQGTNVFNVNSQGMVTFPHNACFNANYRINPFATTYFLGTGVDTFATYDPVYVTVNTGGCWQDIGGQNGFVCPVDGVYEVYGYVQTLGGATGYNTHRIMFWQNQNYTGVVAQNNHPNSESHTLSVKGFLQCVQGDSIFFVISASANARINDANSGLSIRLVG